MILPVLAAMLPIADAANKQMAERLKVPNPAESLCRFVDYEANAAKERFVINTNFWLRGVDFSCVSPWNSGGGVTRAGTAISKRHVVFAKHFPLWKGVRILFVGEDGGVCPCSIEATKPVENADIMVGLLDAEVTPNIHPAKVLPLDWEKYIGRGSGLTIATFTQSEKAVISSLGVIPRMDDQFKQCSTFPSNGRGREAFCHKVQGGDSGNPAFLVVDNQPILLYCLFRGGYGSGPALHLYRREIQAAMDDLYPGYKLEEFDFTKVRCGDGK